LVTTTIEKSCEISSNVDLVWGLVSKIDDDEKYWGAIKDVKILRREGNTIEREATVGLRDHKTRQTIVFDPRKSIRLTLVGDGIRGERTINLVPMGKTSTRIDVAWKMEVLDVPGFVEGLVNRQLSKVTKEALERFKREAEGPRATVVNSHSQSSVDPASGRRSGPKNSVNPR
jgi:hypothetical protein